jgi:Kef-type K+ transport system membrane component KefB
MTGDLASEHAIAALLAALIAVTVGAKLLGALAQRFGQPSVLGELVAGVVLGGSGLRLLHPTDPVIHALAELGVLILLFEIGLHTNLRSLLKVGGTAATVGLVGVALPFIFGYLASVALGVATLPAIVCGAALTATSIGISARVLSDLGQLESLEGQVVLGAAVLDDVVGLVILSVVSGMAAGESVSALEMARISAVAIGFIVAAIVIGGIVAPPTFRRVKQLERQGEILGPMALAFALLLAWLADRSGSAMIIGAFAAGLVLHGTPQRAAIERSVTGLGHYMVPIFFAVVGASVDVRSLGARSILLIGGALIAVGVVTKIAAGYAPWWFRGRKLLVGVAMVPRGEVGLIFAQVGLTTGVLTAPLFSALTLMVIVTTFLAPPLLSRLAPQRAGAEARAGGVADLVSGVGSAS